MFCQKCGAELKEGAAFCAKCGVPVSRITEKTAPSQTYSQTAASPSGYSQPPFPAQQQFAQGQCVPTVQPQAYQQSAAFAVGKPQGMKWYKFIIWIQLFLNALGNLSWGILRASGMLYEMDGVSPVLFYAFYPAMKSVDVTFGIASLALAGFAVYVRFQLSGFKKNAPLLYYICLGANVLVSCADIAAYSTVLGTFAGSSESLGSFIGVNLLFAVSVVYFGKRKHLFVN